jgi:hypothetical protein
MPDTIHASLRQKQLLDVQVSTLNIDHYYREPSNRRNDDGTPVPDRVFIERYVSDGVNGITLQAVIEGTHIPGFFTDETFSFDI